MASWEKLGAVSLFSGCGGSDLGLKDAQIETIWANDINESACEIYDKITGTSSIIHHGDISKVRHFPRADILVGCYPCQGYSQGGRRNNEDKINLLYQEFDRTLRLIKPKAFIVENVNGIRFSQNQHLLSAQIRRFRLAGYRINTQVLNAKDFGLPQDRNRIFIVGIRSSEKKRFIFPKPSFGPTSDQPYRTLRDTIWKYRKAPEGSYNVEPFHWYYLSRNRRRSWDDQAPCVVAHWRHVALHPDSVPLKRIGSDKWEFEREGFSRRFSYLECAALQGFPVPENFKVGSVANRFRAIGNAVPPPLFAVVAKQLRAILEGEV